MAATPPEDPAAAGHPRTIGWLGTVALAMGGSNQSLFLVGALVAAQGTAAVPLLAVGLLLAWMALPGWTELILMWPKRVGGIAATCAEAFRPYSPVLANLTGVAYWWGWVPTCGLTALLSGSALHEWYLPGIPVSVLASGIVVVFTAVNLLGVRWAVRVALPVAFASAALALLSVVVPLVAGDVDFHRATSFHLDLPFHGIFGAITSAMAGLYLIGFAAPAFEAAACHVGETKDPERNVPRAMYGAATMAGLYFLAVPLVWLGVLGRGGLEGTLMHTLGPTFAPLLGGSAKAAAIWFMVFNMFHGTLQPLAGASRTLLQLADDGLLPRALAWRNRFDCPWLATVMTAAFAIAFLQSGDPPWVIAAANFCYLIGIGLPSVAVWLLRRHAPQMRRPYRAPRGTIMLGLVAASAWLVATFLGLEQFGLPTVLASLGMAYSGSTLYAWRRWRDHRAEGGGSRT
ncbi:MAG TPA: APC family permease, partial [Solirubrobacteraceae bacterium]